MCSIIGYIGKEIAAPILVKGLKRMEYRGYDSVGVATEYNNKIEVRKGIGKVIQVNSLEHLDELPGFVGIGHTRWATHGRVTDANAHPHYSTDRKIAIVHNGIIENFTELKEELTKDGFTFQSETDTEAIANLLQKNFSNLQDIKKTLIKTVSQLKGHYSFVAMFEDGTLGAARFHEPLIIGVGSDSYFLSSDVLGFIEQTDEAIYVDNRNFILIDSKGLKVFDFDGNPQKYQITKVSKEFADSYKGDFAHYTLKEIFEQPDTVLRFNDDSKESIKRTINQIKDARNLYITGSGTSYNAALVAKFLLLKYTKIKIEPIIASELQFSPNSIEPNSVLIAISQSGESADVLEAVKIAKTKGAEIISLVNITNSSLARESDIVIGINCGPEIGVAATKSFTSQLCVFFRIIETISDGVITVDFREIASGILEILNENLRIQKISKELKEVSDIYVLGRGPHYPIALEAALKLKELTYVHAEGIPGGELKHGPLALMDSSVYVIIINPHDSTYDDTLTSAREIKARGAKIIGISDINSDIYDLWISIPRFNDMAYPLVEIIPIQLLAYYLALEKETDPDYPRNLAKSVTVK